MAEKSASVEGEVEDEVAEGVDGDGRIIVWAQVLMFRPNRDEARSATTVPGTFQC